MNKRQILEREIERVDTEIRSSKGVRHRIVPLQAIRVLLDYELEREQKAVERALHPITEGD